jgi:hypothetical protein
MRVRVRKALEFAVENSTFMVLGTIVALIWANVDPAGYDAAVHPLHFVVNDVGMVFFCGLAVKEIVEATVPGIEPSHDSLTSSSTGGSCPKAYCFSLQQAKLGALFSLSAAVVAPAAAWVTRAGRFRRGAAPARPLLYSHSVIPARRDGDIAACARSWWLLCPVIACASSSISA